MSDLDNLTKTVSNELSEIKKNLLLKSDIKDVCLLLDMKVNIDDENQHFNEIINELNRKAKAEDLNKWINEQSILFSTLCTENCVGRWIWKSNILISSNNLVPFELENINTSPESFQRDSDCTSIIISDKGIYEISIGFFTINCQFIKINLNGFPKLWIVSTDMLFNLEKKKKFQI